MERIKKHKVKLHFAGLDDAAAVENVLRKMPGVRTVVIDRSSGNLTVHYNLMETGMSAILGVLESAGLPVETGAIGKLKLRLIHFTEENERANLLAPPLPCCTYPDSSAHTEEKVGVNRKIGRAHV